MLFMIFLFLLLAAEVGGICLCLVGVWSFGGELLWLSVGVTFICCAMILANLLREPY